MVLNRIVVIIVSFFLFPFIVKHVGKEVYGVYLMVMTITGYFGMLDLGVMSALTKYVSEYSGKRDYQTVHKIVNASLTFYVLIGIIIAILLFTCSSYFHRIFSVDKSNMFIVRQLFTIAGISALFVWPLSVFRGIIQGLNLWDIDAVVNMLTQIFNALGAFIILSSGYGIVELLIVSQVLTVSGSLALFYISVKRFNLKIHFPYVEMETFKFIFSFSFFMFLSSLIHVFIFQIHNVFIGYFLSMSAVTVYAVAYNVQNYFRIINSTLGTPPWTIASQMEGSEDYAGQRRLLLTGTKYMTAVFLPLVLVVLIFAEPLIIYWMGPGFHDSILPARILILFWLFNGTLELASGMLTAKGIVKEVLFIQLLVAALNVLVGVSLIKFLGITAISIGLTLSMVCIGFPMILRLSLRSLGLTLKEYMSKAVRRNLLLYLFVAVIALVTSKYFYPSNIQITLVEMGIIYSMSLLMHYMITLNKDEKSEIRILIGTEQARNKIVLIKEQLWG